MLFAFHIELGYTFTYLDLQYFAIEMYQMCDHGVQSPNSPAQ